MTFLRAILCPAVSAEQEIAEEEALAKGMAEKAEKFPDQSSVLYGKA